MPSSLRVVRVRTDDADEICDRLASDFGNHARIPVSRGPMGYELVAIGTPRVMGGTTSSRLGSTVRAATAGPTLHVPLDAAGHYRVGRRQIVAGADVGALLAPGHEYTARLTSGSWMALRIDPHLLRETLDGRSGLPPRAWSIDSLQLALSGRDRAIVRATIARLAELDATAVRSSHASVEDLERNVAQWLVDRLLATRGVNAVPRDASGIAERADRWIRANVALPIRLEDVARVVGTSERVLQRACIARFGRSPLELVASQRMAAARARLLAAPSTVTVTRAAIECGFNHLGRFAVAYKQAYGESPSETIARRTGARTAPLGPARLEPRPRRAPPATKPAGGARERARAA